MIRTTSPEAHVANRPFIPFRERGFKQTGVFIDGDIVFSHRTRGGSKAGIFDLIGIFVEFVKDFSAGSGVLQEQTGQTMMDVLEKALHAYRRKLFFERRNAGHAELQADPAAFTEHLADRKLWDSTLMDGLDPKLLMAL